MKDPHRRVRFAAAALVIAVSGISFLLVPAEALAAAPPKSGNYMQPVDTSPGSISDPKRLLQVDMDKFVSVNVSGQPAEVAYNQLSALVGIEWGFAPGTDKTTPVSLSVEGRARDVLSALGHAAGVRFEANGPLQLRVVRARLAAPPKKAAPPPHQP